MPNKHMPWRPKSIRAKLSALTLSFLLLTVGLVLLLVYVQQKSLLQTQWAESIRAQARLLANNSEATLAFFDRREGERVLSSLSTNPAIASGRILLPDDKTFAHYQRNSSTLVPLPDKSAPSGFYGEYLLVREPIVIPGQQQPAGEVELFVSLEPLHQSMRQTLLETSLLLLLALISALLVTRFVVSRITRPIEQLDALAQQVSRQGTVDARIDIRSDDELGNLAHGFNRMLDSLKARDLALAAHQDALEGVVAERTRDLQTAIAEAREANRAKSDFLARMSHEIRTPLNAVTGLSRLVLDTPLSAQQREYLEQVLQSSDALLGIINDILDYSKMEAGRLTLEQSPFRLGDIFRSLESLFAAKARAQGIRLSLSADPMLPTQLEGDALRLGQVLINLVSNALKFTSSGEIAAHARQIASLPDGRVNIEFSVRDTGIGIAEAQQANLFAPFTQADSSITRRFGGTGLGLAISRQLVELMGGQITIQSQAGVGSTFAFQILLGARREMPAPPALTVNAKNAANFPRWAGERILVVEDIAINRTIAVALLQKVGFSVAIAIHGQDALDKLATEDFALVLMDIQMPVMDGLAATRAIRQKSPPDQLPIIAMTAHVTAEDQRQTREAGMNAHLTKPIVPQTLYETLAAWLPPIREKAPDISTEEAAAEPALPPLAGIETATGLVLHMNRPALYRKSLHAFRHDFADTSAQIRLAMANHQPVEARRLAHSLKSVAAALGAGHLSEQARQVEHALAQGGADLAPLASPSTSPLASPPASPLASSLTTLLAALDQALSEVITGLQHIPPPPVSECRPQPADHKQLKALIISLGDMLHQADARAEATCAQLAQMINADPELTSHCASALGKVQNLIEDVEYPAALAALDALGDCLKEASA